MRTLTRAGKPSATKASVESLEQRTLLSAWGTVYDNNAGQSPPTVGAMASDASGNVYACGRVNSSGSGYGVVLEKPSGSSTWNTIEDDRLGGVLTLTSIAVDPAGDVYVAGSTSSSGNANWVVLERPAGSPSFSVVDSVVDSLTTSCSGVAADAAGNVYAVGETNVVTTSGKGKNATTTTQYYWTVRKQTGGHGAFTTVDNFQLSASANTDNAPKAVTAINSGASAGVYVAGECNGDWMVRKSTDGGSTWSVVDNFTYAAGYVSNPQGIAGDAAGNLFVVGNASSGHWLVRESSNGGASWSTVDDYQLSAGVGAAAASVGADLAGNVYVAGTASDGTTTHAIVRTNAGGSWSTADNFQYASGKNAHGHGFTVDGNGNLYTSDDGQDSSGAWHWVIRSAAGPTGPTAAPQASSAMAAAVFSSTAIAGSDDSAYIIHMLRRRR